MSKNLIKYITLAAGIGVASVASAADVLVTPMPAKGGTEIVFEFVNDESNVTALEFDVKLDGIRAGQLDKAGCAKGIFTNHTGACAFNNGVLTVLVYSPANEVLPTFELGSVFIKGSDLNLKSLTASNLVMADERGNEIRGGSVMLDKSHLRSGVTK